VLKTQRLLDRIPSQTIFFCLFLVYSSFVSHFSSSQSLHRSPYVHSHIRRSRSSNCLCLQVQSTCKQNPLPALENKVWQKREKKKRTARIEPGTFCLCNLHSIHYTKGVFLKLCMQHDSKQATARIVRRARIILRYLRALFTPCVRFHRFGY
jgi:hypothetical protein